MAVAIALKKFGWSPIGICTPLVYLLVLVTTVVLHIKLGTGLHRNRRAYHKQAEQS
jgi:hypothetical protein